jgi:hypothetical protein
MNMQDSKLPDAKKLNASVFSYCVWKLTCERQKMHVHISATGLITGTCGSRERNVNIWIDFRKSPRSSLTSPLSQEREKSSRPVFTMCDEPCCWNMHMHFLSLKYDYWWKKYGLEKTDKGDWNFAFWQKLGDFIETKAKKSPTSPGLVSPQSFQVRIFFTNNHTFSSIFT